MLDSSGWGAYLAWDVQAAVPWICIITFKLLPVFLIHKGILCNRKVRLKERLHFFDRVITSVATFGAGHRTLYQSDLCHIGCRVSKIATYGGGSSWKFGLVMPLARSPVGTMC